MEHESERCVYNSTLNLTLTLPITSTVISAIFLCILRVLHLHIRIYWNLCAVVLIVGQYKLCISCTIQTGHAPSDNGAISIDILTAATCVDVVLCILHDVVHQM